MEWSAAQETKNKSLYNAFSLFIHSSVLRKCCDCLRNVLLRVRCGCHSAITGEIDSVEQ